MKFYVTWEQEDKEGKQHQYTEWFESEDARNSFIEQQKFSANFIGKPFRVIQLW